MLLTRLYDHQIALIQKEFFAGSVHDDAPTTQSIEQLRSIVSMPMRPGAFLERDAVEPHGLTISGPEKPLCRGRKDERGRVRSTVIPALRRDLPHDSSVRSDQFDDSVGAVQRGDQPGRNAFFGGRVDPQFGEQTFDPVGLRVLDPNRYQRRHGIEVVRRVR